VGFVVDKVALGDFFQQESLFSPSNNHFCILAMRGRSYMTPRYQMTAFHLIVRTEEFCCSSLTEFHIQIVGCIKLFIHLMSIEIKN
jgi:hypothetical protein